MAFKSGFVSIVGRPNVGKSTLLNKFTGEKLQLCLTSPRQPEHYTAIDTGEDYQIYILTLPVYINQKQNWGISWLTLPWIP